LSLAVHRVSTVGTITSYQASDCFKNKDHSHAEILFLTSDDLPVTFEDTIDFSCNHHVGESVPVFYNPDDPQEAEVAFLFSLFSNTIKKPPAEGSSFNQYILDLDNSDSPFAKEYREILRKNAR